MQAWRAPLISALLLAALVSPAPAQSPAPNPAGAGLGSSHPARELTLSKCFQCHSENIWRDQRLDARGWEATLYRMLARGAVWSAEEIKTMGDFLAADFGPQSPRSSAPAR